MHICDVTSTFNLLLSLMAETGTFSGSITVHPLYVLGCETGLTNAFGLVQWKKGLAKVKSFDLAFLDDWRGDIYSTEEA